MKILLLVTMMLTFASLCIPAQAESISLSYVDVDSVHQTLTIDCNSTTEDLRLAAELLAEDGVERLLLDESSCSLADIAGALAAAAPGSAADIALALVALAPDEQEEIVAAIVAVTGVNQEAVYAAVHFGPPGVGLGLTEDEPVASKN
ncbi:MAG: hypothetical protein OQJ84_11635 [Xanthomonadales bacterium]|nr:hypothetical protein [Xanthomonadales bacterium]